MRNLVEVTQLITMLTEVKDRLEGGEEVESILSIDPVSMVPRLLPRQAKLPPKPVHKPKRPFTVSEAIQIFTNTKPNIYWKMNGKPLLYEKLVFNLDTGEWGLKLAEKKSGTLSPYTLMYHTVFEDGSSVGGSPEAGSKGTGHIKFPITGSRVRQALQVATFKRFRPLTVEEIRKIYKPNGQLTDWTNSVVYPHRGLRVSGTELWDIVGELGSRKLYDPRESMNLRFNGKPLCVQQELQPWSHEQARTFYLGARQFMGPTKLESIRGFTSRGSEWQIQTDSGDYGPLDLVTCKDLSGNYLGVWVDKVS